MRLRVSFDDHLYVGAKMLIFAIVCGGFAVGLVGAQRLTSHGPVGDNEETLSGNEAPVPISLARQLNAITSMDEFLQILHDVPESEKKRPTLASRFGGGMIEERSNFVLAKPAACIPELQPVSLKLDDDPSTFVFPPCTRVNRCGGCCGSSLLSCQPKATQTRNFQVIVATLRLSYTERRIVPLEEHTECHCDCKTKAKDCTEKQHYEPENCMCQCSNEDEANKCYSSPEKQWDPSRCVCTCRTVHECTTGSYFDHNTCRCRQIVMFRPVNRFASTKDSNYDFANIRQESVPPVIIPLDTSNPRRKHKEDPEYK